MPDTINKHIFPALGGQCELVIGGISETDCKPLYAMAEAELARIEEKYSRYREDSLLSRINSQAGLEPVSCDQETLQLLDYANSLYESSDGMFDITSGVLRRAWNFAEPALPDQSTLDSLLELVNWPTVEIRGDLNNKHIRLPRADMEIDFGGFGKEYAADRVAMILEEAGVSSGYVNLAGDFRVIGPKPGGNPWILGIQHPRLDKTVIAHVPVVRGALTTSGDYERFFEIDGVRYCHVLSPLTGMPVSHWQSVTVVAPLAIVAGSCTTIAMLKQEQGLDYLHETGLDFLAVDRDGRIHQNTQDIPRKQVS